MSFLTKRSYIKIFSILFGQLLLLSGTIIFAQNYQFSEYHTIEKQADFIAVDKMNNLFVVSNSHSIEKFDSKGNLLYTFSENRLGEITHLDVSNPFRILIYFGDYTSLIYADRTLSEISRHDFSDFNLPQIQVIAQASDNNIWFFDNENYTLKKINSQNEIILESNDLNLLIDEDIYPDNLVEHNLKLYLNANGSGILVFDIFANYIKTLNISNDNFFQFYENQIFYIENNNLKSYNLQSFNISKVDIPLSLDGVNQFCIGQDLMVLKLKNKISLIKITKK